MQGLEVDSVVGASKSHMEEAMDWSAVNWLNLSVLTASAFLSALIGSFIGRRSYALTAFLSAIVFAALYVGWSGYLQQQLDQVDVVPHEVQQEPTAVPPPTSDTPSGTEIEEGAP